MATISEYWDGCLEVAKGNIFIQIFLFILGVAAYTMMALLSVAVYLVPVYIIADGIYKWLY